MVAYANSFVYHQGILCYSGHPGIRILDLHSNSTQELIVSVSTLTQSLAELGLSVAQDDFCQSDLSVLSYADGVVVVLFDLGLTTGAWLFALEVGPHFRSSSRQLGSSSTILLRHQLRSKSKIFVRHNASYLYYGTHSVYGSHRHHEWLLQGFNLRDGEPLWNSPFQLGNFVGADIGATACFGIYDGVFYGVSNQPPYQEDESNVTSYYHCFWFPLGDSNPLLTLRKIWRRQHREGPINDIWNDLCFQVDEQSRDMLLVECRKEWLGGGSTNVRTSYTTVFDPDLCIFDRDDGGLRSPPADRFSQKLDEELPSGCQKRESRIPRYQHREYPETSTTPIHDFIRAKTKYHAYNVSAASFVDLVASPLPIPGSPRGSETARLRVASRLEKSPLEPDPTATRPGALRPRRQRVDANGHQIAHSEEAFHDSEIYLWPPDDAPADLFELLCPGGRAGPVQRPRTTGH